ncbi:16677_t:CDS:2, partial [Dentiscutata erythropus]
MVINALTDEKSIHIPYRDSKLTIILQESLGGNCRTILIINSSPSSFNEAETLSTLRFGMRAKTIKNKIKANAELGPAELKALLNNTKYKAVSFQTYIAALEEEIGLWRSGGSVPKGKWVSIEKITGSLPGTPDQTSVERDERNEFLILENELNDQIAEKESELTTKESFLVEINEDLKSYKEQKETIFKENNQMAIELNELKVQLEKVTYDHKEDAIIMDSLREQNSDLATEIEELKKAIFGLKLSRDKEQKNLAQIFVELDPSDAISAKEKQFRDTLLKLENVEGDGSISFTLEELATVRRELAESKELISTHEQFINEAHYENERLTRQRDEFEIRLSTLETEYEELLENSNSNIDIIESIAELRGKLEAQFSAKKEVQQKEIEELKQEIEKKNEELHKLYSALTDLKRENEELQKIIFPKNDSNDKEKEGESDNQKNVADIEKDMAQQLADFDLMKKDLMLDLQNRCEKLVELEISLDETREQYNNVLRSNNNKASQKT